MLNLNNADLHLVKESILKLQLLSIRIQEVKKNFELDLIQTNPSLYIKHIPHVTCY
jgi:hypothetical protein